MMEDSCSVYLFGYPHEAHGHVVKVGISNNVFSRLGQIQSHSPETIIPHFNFDLRSRDVARDIEARFHRHFSAYGIRGEWFAMGEYHALFMLTLEVVRVLGERYPIEIIAKARRDSGLLKAFELLDARSDAEQQAWNNEWYDLVDGAMA